MSQSTKVYEFAKELGMETLTLMDKIREWKLPIKSHMAALDAELVTEIKTRLDDESKPAKKVTKKKKVAKKKTAAKKTAAKKTAKKKATTTKKKVVKKTAVKKAITKKTAAAAKAEEKEEKTAKKTVGKKKTVIRRKAADKEQAAIEAAKKAEEEAAAKAAAEAAAAAGEEVVADEVAMEAGAEATGQAPAEKAKRVVGRNIVGKIDLAKTTRPSRPQSSGTGSAQGGARTSGARNIRTGFIAPSLPDATEEQNPRKAKEERVPKKKPAAGAGTKEVPQQSFTSSEFRKREVIFQPKKKRALAIRADMKQTQITTPKASKRIVKMHNEISVSELAAEMKVKAPQLIRVLIKNGVMANMNTSLDFDTVSLISPEFGFETQNMAKTEEELIQDVAFGNLEAEPITRPPVVTVMGHVDHGKTSLLDSIRKADVASGEAGGITQHIGAYSVKTPLGEITFVDTPGHAAFTAMRARGANLTDIAIIIVAADDGVMPQTEEAINHAKAAEVPIIVAINKMDKEGANPDKIKQQLTEYELVPEEWGGTTIFCEVAAINGTGIDNLLEQINLLAEIQEYKANPERSGKGIVIEAKMEKGRGAVASILVKDGTVRVKDIIAAGKVIGKIRAMTNDKGQQVKEVTPGQPVEIIGLPEAPQAGDIFDICESDTEAAKLVDYRVSLEELEVVPSSQMSLDQIFAKVKQGDMSELPVILKGDVAGSLEAIKSSFEKLDNEEVKVKVIHSAVGGVTESDVLLASTSGALILGFNVRPDTASQRLAKEKSIEIKCYKIIYELLDDIKQAMSGLLKPDLVENNLGAAEVRDIFSVPKLGTIAGCFVTDGKVIRGSKVRLVREGRLIYDGVMSSLKRFKDDAKEVASGYECGIGIENYNDIKVGDIIEAYKIDEVARSLE